MFPTHRPRRLRGSPAIRDLVRETRLHAHDFVYPLFVQEQTPQRQAIKSMPGQYRHSIDSLLKRCEDTVASGVRSILLFGIPNHKDPVGSQAYAEDGIVQRAIRAIKAEGFPLLVMGDVCLCEYTDHGHCGHIHNERVVNDESVQLLVKAALSQARAGADVIAPSDMMDGRIGAIRQALDGEGFEHLPILSYAAKYSSAYYGPFRDAAGSTPSFGDRKSYQMDPANRREALKEVQLDIDEGADMVMVKPALAYLDIIRDVREMTEVPVAAYSVSGEYAMLELMAREGLMDRRQGVLESLTSIRRAGADIILTYHAVEAANWINEGTPPSLLTRTD
jgi:porphobilinogen synthase